jgi:hypothetical protein
MYSTGIISYKYIDEDIEKVGVDWFVMSSHNIHEDTEEIHEDYPFRPFHPEI